MRTTSTQSGFSLIEMIVSLALFSVVMTISVGALLSLIGSNDQLRSEQSVMTNLAFALDSMSREIRTGSYYNCADSDFLNQNMILGTTTQNCDSGAYGISFIEGGDSITVGSGGRRIAYYLDQGKIMRRVGNSSQSMTADDIYIAELKFWVSGSDTLLATTGTTNDTNQPLVTIFIDARESATGQSNYVQTTITQRSLDL